MTSRIDALIDAVEKHLSMDDLMGTLAAIRDLDRWFTFPKFLESAHRTADELKAVGCDEAEVVEFPADGKSVFADFVMPLAWDVTEATLEIVTPEGEAKVIARRSDEPNITVMWCGPTPPEGVTGGIVLWDDVPKEERDGVDLTGKFLYTRSKPAGCKAAAVKGGALGVIGSYGFGDRQGEFRDCVCWNNSWSETAGWAMVAGDRELPGFNITPAHGEELERLANEDVGLTLKATVDSRLYEGTIPTVSARMQGASDDEVVLIGHQFEIGANDNASGCAAIVEAARCVKRMVDGGDLPELKRSARFMTCSEMYSSIPYAVAEPEVIAKMFAGLDLDMICPYKGYESPMDFYQSPDANPYFGDDLLELIVRRVWERNSSPWPWKRMPTELSDNCWCDPYVGVPMSWISWHGREFWHSSGDTLERLVPDAIRDVTLVSITWLAFLLTASDDDVAWLSEAELALARERVAAADGDHRDYVLMREIERLESIRALGATDAAEVFAAENEPPEPVAADPDDEAAQLVPVRKCAAPLTFHRIPKDEREFPSPLWSSFYNSVLYWANGERTVREIERLASLEHDKEPPVDLLAWFKFLEKYGYVELTKG
jgi:peptidase M28-like protein